MHSRFWLAFLIGHFFRNFASTASAAESLRSRCGSVRKAPECSSQGSSIAAAQVGQGTEWICWRVSSLLFTVPSWNVLKRGDAQYCSVFAVDASEGHIGGLWGVAFVSKNEQIW